MAVEFSFKGSERLNNGQVTKINHDYRYALDGLPIAPERDEEAGGTG
jgi:hypothetical protein